MSFKDPIEKKSNLNFLFTFILDLLSYMLHYQKISVLDDNQVEIIFRFKIYHFFMQSFFLNLGERFFYQLNLMYLTIYTYSAFDAEIFVKFVNFSIRFCIFLLKIFSRSKF